jgi:hypothetical protein
LLKRGWTDPHFHYNRVSDDVNFSPDLRLTDDREMDDMIMPVLYTPASTPEERRKTLAQVMHHYNTAPAAPAGHSEAKPLGLTSAELRQLEAFLRALSGGVAANPAYLAAPPEADLRP